MVRHTMFQLQEKQTMTKEEYEYWIAICARAYEESEREAHDLINDDQEK